MNPITAIATGTLFITAAFGQTTLEVRFASEEVQGFGGTAIQSAPTSISFGGGGSVGSIALARSDNGAGAIGTTRLPLSVDYCNVGRLDIGVRIADPLGSTLALEADWTIDAYQSGNPSDTEMYPSDYRTFSDGGGPFGINAIVDVSSSAGSCSSATISSAFGGFFENENIGWSVSASVTGSLRSVEARPIELASQAFSGEMRVGMTDTYRLDQVATQRTCTPLVNSTGAEGLVHVFGSPLSSGDGLLRARADDLPPGAAAILFVARQGASVPAGTYNLCIEGPVDRQGGVQLAADGSAVFAIDVSHLDMGTTAYVQVVHRDPVLDIAATEAISFTVL